MALITPSQVKPMLGIPDSEIRADTALAAWIAEASAIVLSHLSQPIELTALTDVLFSGNGCTAKTLGYFPMSALIGVSHRTGFGTGATWTPLAGSEYELAGNTIVTSNNLTEGVLNWKASFSVGYSAVPADIQEVLIDMVAIRAKESNLMGFGSNRLGATAVSEAHDGISVSTTYLSTMTRHETILAPYRRILLQ